MPRHSSFAETPVVIEAAIYTVSPTSVPASSLVVTVHGEGFDAEGAAYTCEFAALNGTGLAHMPPQILQVRTLLYFHIKALILHKLGSRKFTTQNDIY